jgi:hypothetical protein
MSSGKRILICKHCGGKLLTSKLTKSFRHDDGTSFGVQYCENRERNNEFYTYKGRTAEPIQEEDIIDKVMKKYYEV